jgi:chromosome segregation ATPase
MSKNTDNSDNTSNASNTDQNAEVLNLLSLLLTRVNTITVDVQEVKTNQQVLAVDVQEVKTSQQVLAADVQEIKSWSRVSDNRMDNMENKLVDFATQISKLNEKVESRLYDTRPVWKDALEHLTRMESSLESLKADVVVIKLDQETLKQNQEHLEKEFTEFRQQVLSRLGELKDNKHYVDFLTLKSARMQLELNELKTEVATLQQKQ